MHFLLFSLQFDRDTGLDQGRLSLNHLVKGTLAIWVATSATEGKQYPESFHEKGGMLPPQYRVPGLGKYMVGLEPVYMPDNPGVAGNFYPIKPFEIRTDKGGVRGDFGIHKDGNVPGSLGCIVLTGERFQDFEKRVAELRELKEIPLFVQYS